MSYSRPITLLLAISAINLALMVPGGVVETRSFPTYPVAVLAGFNLFLTVLGLGSLFLAYRAARYGRTGVWPLLAGLGFVAVYGLDLAVIFPVSENQMSPLLETLEWVGTGLGVMLIAFGAAATTQGEAETRKSIRMPTGLMLAFAGVTLAIVAFATYSAL